MGHLRQLSIMLLCLCFWGAPASSDDVITLESFGCVPDGVMSCSAALREALAEY